MGGPLRVLIRARSTAHLQQARETAAKKRKYNILDTRTRLEYLFSELSGFKPCGWQLDVAGAILLGPDCVVIDGTGSGKSCKTIPFMSPLLLHPNKMTLKIIPLKVLQRDHVCLFRPFTYQKSHSIFFKIGTKVPKNEDCGYSSEWRHIINSFQGNHTGITPSLCLINFYYIQNLVARRYNAILTSPKMCLSTHNFANG